MFAKLLKPVNIRAKTCPNLGPQRSLCVSYCSPHSCLWRGKDGGQVSWMSCSPFSEDVVDPRKYTANL